MIGVTTVPPSSSSSSSSSPFYLIVVNFIVVPAVYTYSAPSICNLTLHERDTSLWVQCIDRQTWILENNNITYNESEWTHAIRPDRRQVCNRTPRLMYEQIDFSNLRKRQNHWTPSTIDVSLCSPISHYPAQKLFDFITSCSMVVVPRIVVGRNKKKRTNLPAVIQSLASTI